MSGAGSRHFLAAVLGGAPFTLTLDDPPRVLARQAILAGDSVTRRRGLLGRDGLADGEALVVAPTQGIHTFRMRFPIDVAFVDRDGVVLRVAAGVPPNRVRTSWRAFAAIELAAGRYEALGVSPGDRIVASNPDSSVYS